MNSTLLDPSPVPFSPHQRHTLWGPLQNEHVCPLFISREHSAIKGTKNKTFSFLQITSSPHVHATSSHWTSLIKLTSSKKKLRTSRQRPQSTERSLGPSHEASPLMSSVGLILPLLYPDESQHFSKIHSAVINIFVPFFFFF